MPVYRYFMCTFSFFFLDCFRCVHQSVLFKSWPKKTFYFSYHIWSVLATVCLLSMLICWGKALSDNTDVYHPVALTQGDPPPPTPGALWFSKIHNAFVYFFLFHFVSVSFSNSHKCCAKAMGIFIGLNTLPDVIVLRVTLHNNCHHTKHIQMWYYVWMPVLTFADISNSLLRNHQNHKVLYVQFYAPPRFPLVKMIGDGAYYCRSTSSSCPQTFILPMLSIISYTVHIW